MCQDRVMKLLIFGFIAGFLLQECHASPHPASSSLSKERRGGTTAEEDDYNYDDEDEPSKELGTNDVNGADLNTMLLTKNHTVETEINDTVTLPCRVTNPQNNTIVMWFKTTTLLYVRDNKHSKDPRLSLGSDYSLTIQNVNVEDDSIYKCIVYPVNKSAYITLKVRGPPYNVMITHGNNDHTNRNLVIQQRDRKFIIHCRASGFPTPLISWSFRGKHLDENHAKQTGINIRKEFLEIHDVKPHHAGDYECLAQNGIGEPVSAAVNVQIKSRVVLIGPSEDDSSASPPDDKEAMPSIAKHIDYLNTAIGDTAELVCLYHSDPTAIKIQWFRGDEPLHDSAKFTISRDHHNHHMRTRLTVKDVEQKDLVTYVCKITNNLGEAMAKTTLGLLPGAAHLANFSYSDGLLHTIWRVRSVQPLSDLQILYKGENTKYTTIDATISEQNKEENGDFWNIKRSIRLPEGEWFITARAKNTEGWAYTETVPLQFQIPGEVSLENRAPGGSSGASIRQVSSASLAVLVLLAVLRRMH
ncbi:protein amalgam isoform X1 [Aedes aegypti]|uniref:Ig-like domain-containing protein n=1 Tax=Aedes aegypti TaxID=7159 RepID=A0A6I8T959_AEDAE|nr:protein amalgam isoform X1 [Aedes aegypti]XP_021708441.1 protein amalgam isoform X1 [Aedes aegypti]XP_021708442.1 protein amalgam isoform X1 [Aedes aegypti]XP_021708443.1 protein amalgam isoform X1 [Aedes aegypti]XP_021708444.1 protein amalgam isoform X1 [Aedes aegypti]XP_021708445.1 protein amalgam isoform X1 [Aedes aegypti]XP_021708446.1 protein amalgam isoform X1 [Aedes aegypti]XP_021708447.1 protein amalgam isoform X1 [Aedes aegypti]XP_021708448.1 protein amalgam isoform X1 [Aedes ae